MPAWLQAFLDALADLWREFKGPLGLFGAFQLGTAHERTQADLRDAKRDLSDAEKREQRRAKAAGLSDAELVERVRNRE